MNYVRTPKPGETKGVKAQPGRGWKKYFAGSALIISATAALLMHDCTPNGQVKAAPVDTRPLSVIFHDECWKCCRKNIEGCMMEKRDSLRLAKSDSIGAVRDSLRMAKRERLRAVRDSLWLAKRDSTRAIMDSLAGKSVKQDSD